MTYLKITNLEENHNGLQYSTGLIEDIIPFEKEGSCVPGGIYFSDEKNICQFIWYGVWIREVTIPSDAEIVQDPGGGKWRASKVMLGERRSLSEISTLEWMISIGVDVHADNEGALRYTAEHGHLEVAKYLVSLGADIHADNEGALRWACRNEHLEVAKYLVSLGADIHADNESALRHASGNGHFDILKYLVSVGADIHANEEEALGLSSYYGFLEIVKYLVSQGADIYACNEWALKNASNKVAEFLKSCNKG